MVEGRNFAVRTDHRPLTYAFLQKTQKCLPRQQRYLDIIGQFTTRIIHIAGTDNVMTDALSRIEEVTTPPIIDFDEFARHQDEDDELQQLIASSSTSLKLQKFTPIGAPKPIFCDVVSNEIRPFVPSTLRKNIFLLFHRLSHHSGRSTAKMAKKKFVWPRMESDIKRWARSCIPCQRSKVLRHINAPLQAFQVPEERFQHVHVDIIGPLPPSDGFRYCLTMIDRFSRWSEISPMIDKSAETVAKTFYQTWISRYGCPLKITDQGRQFEASLTSSLTNLLDILRCRTTPYRQCNGMIERWHRCVKASLRCYEKENWSTLLPTVLLDLRTTIKENLNCSPAELVFGALLRLPGEYFFSEISSRIEPSSFVDILRNHMRSLRAIPATHHGERFRPPSFVEFLTCFPQR